MKVLITTDVVGGVWDFSVTLSRALVRAHQCDVTLLALGQPSTAQRTQAAAAGATLRAEDLKLEWMQDAEPDIAATPGLVEQVAHDTGADVVHANQFAAACAKVEVPVVLTLHSDVLSWRRWALGPETGVPPEWRAYASLVREALQRAGTVTAVSHFLASEVRELYGYPGRIETIHNGWPATPVPAAAPRRRITVLAGRAWDSAKNIALAAAAAQGWQPGEVCVAGETRHPDGGDATLPSPLQPLGFLSRTELDGWLDRAAVYLSPARYDPFGLLPLQAALHGCALLLSDIPSYRELWQDAAVFFRCDDAADLRQQWAAMLDDPAEWAARARQRALERYTIERMADEYARLYAQVPV